jgi:methylated-DNA-[protein]-cysteine S-methyltransferase
MQEAYYHTPVGYAHITADDNYITKIAIQDGVHTTDPVTSPLLNLAIQQLDEYFAGERKIFDLPINQPGTAFQQQVWQQLLQIQYGVTTSYAALSNQMNNPLAIRAIAAANGKNKLWIIVPCHRVIGSNGSLTGYAGGLWRKQWLLDHEARTTVTGQTKLFF